MRTQNRTEVKNVVAIVVIIASFIFAVTFAILANNRQSYWVATRDMTPGHIVDSIDFKVVKAAFNKESAGYIPANQSPVGFSISRFIGAGEFLNQFSLAESNGESNVKLLAFAVAAPDLPTAIRIGDEVTLYQVVNDNGSDHSVPSELVIENVYVVDLNRKSENLGGVAILTVAIPNDYVERALNATRRGRMVVVINHG